MIFLLLGLALFLVSHTLTIWAPHWRARSQQALGNGIWLTIMVGVSLLSLALISYGYAQARLIPTVLYVAPGWMRRVTDVLMLPVFPLVFAAFMPCRIRETLKYPDLIAVKLWACAHLAVNGNLEDLLLFGSLLMWAVVQRVSLRYRQRALPSAAPSPYNDLVAIIAGLFTYLTVVLFLHYTIIGRLPV